MTVQQSAAIHARIVRAPELRFTPAGKPMTTFTAATSTRKRTLDGWEDGPSTFIKVRTFDRTAEYLAESDLQPGDPVLLVGELTVNAWLTKEGEPRADLELLARTVAVDLHRCPITLRRVDRHEQALRDTGGKPATARPIDWTTTRHEEAPF